MLARWTTPLTWSLLFALMSLAACTGPREAEDRAGERTTVRVESQHRDPVVVYAVRIGQRRRLGRVSPFSTEVFELPRTLVSENGVPLRFLIDYLGSERPPVTREIIVYAGDQVEVSVPSF